MAPEWTWKSENTTKNNKSKKGESGLLFNFAIDEVIAVNEYLGLSD